MDAAVAVVGSFVQDLAFRVGEFPESGQTIIGRFFTGPGGKGSNQAVACHRQGTPTIFVGAVGDDIFAAGYREWCKGEGLPIKLQTISGQTSGAASIVVNERAHNAIVVALGANDQMTSEHVLGALSGQRDLRVVLLQAESNLQAAESALQYARQHEIVSVFNPAPINPGVTSALLELADIITPNETELAFLLEVATGRKFSEDVSKLSDDSIRELCAFVPSSAVLITLGESGSLYYQRATPHGRLKNVRLGDIVRTPAISVNALDTTGAGDAFNGGFASGLVRFDGDLRKAIRYATVVAGLSTEKFGTAPAMPRRVDVEKRESFYE